MTIWLMPFLFVAKHPCSLGGWKIRTIEDSKKAAIKLFYGACSANMSKSQTAGRAEFLGESLCSSWRASADREAAEGGVLGF